MAQSFVTQDGVLLIAPGTYVSTTVQSNQANTASAGVVTLIGEADEGPGFLQEADLSSSVFSPDQFARVQQKYGSGRIVDAFNQVVSASNDPNILGAVNLIRIVKTNQSQQAAATIKNRLLSSYSSLLARKNGVSGNTIKYKAEILTAEVAPTSAAFSYTPNMTASTSVALRINGGAKQTTSVAAKTAPDAIGLENVAEGTLVKGGIKNQAASVLAGIVATLTVQTDPSLVTITLATGSVFGGTIKAGQTAIIPLSGEFGAVADSALVGASNANAGVYIVQQVSNTVTNASLLLKKVSVTSSLNGAYTLATVNDLLIYSEMEIQNISGDRKLSTVGLSGTFNVSVNDGLNITIDAPADWSKKPAVGDYLKIASAFAGATAGFYQVTSSDDDSVTATRLSNGTSGVTGSQVIASPIVAGTEPFQILSSTIAGIGKTLSIESDVEAIFRKSDGSGATLSNSQKISASEEKVQTSYTKDLVSESFKSGGEIVLAVSCSQDDASMVISADKIEFYIASVLKFTADLKTYKTLSQLAAYVSSQQYFSASVTSARYQSVFSKDLDKVTATISGLAGQKNGRIKKDTASWLTENSASALVKATAIATSGNPAPMDADIFLQGGTKGATTSALVTTAIDACEKLETNFIVPLFSQDADADIALEETDAASTYTIDAINIYSRAHAVKMSGIKARKNRIAIVSKSASYADDKEAAGELSSFRAYLCFQNFRTVSVVDGTIKVFQPWMAAVDAVGMQCAAGYKGIVKKQANCSGISMPLNDFDPNMLGDVEDALKSGMLFMERIATGGFRWVSDQSTYSIDSNFVYNSLQAVYISDLITLTLIQEFDRLVIGKSVAEISAATALSILETQMFNFKRLRFITSSDDAPKGYKNAKAKINGGVLEIGVEIKLAGLIYFAPISLAISQVQQSAEQ